MRFFRNKSSPTRLAVPQPYFFHFFLGLIVYLCASSALHAQVESGESKPTIIINKYVLRNFSAYQVTVFSDGRVNFYGLDSRVKGEHTFVLTLENYQRALQVFEEIDFKNLESGVASFMFARATVTLDRNGVRKTVHFPSKSEDSGRKYANLIRSLEERLQLRDLICPRLQPMDGETKDACLIEDRFLDQLLKGTK
jgi:hypothetical protein